MDRVGSTAAAALAGIKPRTWSAYVARGHAPTPDGREEISGTPWWWADHVRAWMAGRPGQGARTDLRIDLAFTRLSGEVADLIEAWSAAAVDRVYLTRCHPRTPYGRCAATSIHPTTVSHAELVPMLTGLVAQLRSDPYVLTFTQAGWLAGGIFLLRPIGVSECAMYNEMPEPLQEATSAWYWLRGAMRDKPDWVRDAMPPDHPDDVVALYRVAAQRVAALRRSPS